ncbi:MAG TPA: FtsX-like permease family protein, partial [Gemmatimonadaceae bacterium]|nr:FtsX-like permease family protein [Gemmatimonadaceae bacterium]
AQRTREMGIRMALGASPAKVMGDVLRRGLAMALVGLFVGVPLAMLISKLIASQLYGVGRTNPGAFIVGSILLMVVVVLACGIPARRATRIDVAAIIRED